jgi:cytochrome c oxidase subunit 2
MMSGFWPERASVHAGHVDVLMWGFTAIVALLSGPVFVLLAVFASKYRRGKAADRTGASDHSVGIEVAWAVVPFLLTVGFFVYAAWLAIDVVAKQWMWKFQHPQGQSEIDDLHVPVGQPVKLVMTSQDVIHSLYLPALRIKQDVLPGRYTTLWFNADRVGTYMIACAEFCGTDHSVMGGRLFVMRQADYARWLATVPAGPDLAGRGRTLYGRLGCGGCHDAGSSIRAPSLAGVAGSPVPLADGRVVVADGQYLHDAIVLPNKDVAAGYASVMPTYGNMVDEGDLAALVAYLQSMAPAQKEAGR